MFVTKKFISVIGGLGIAAIVGAPAASAQTAERTKAIKTIASKIKPRKLGQFTLGKGLVDGDTIIVPLSALTTETVDEQKAAAVIDGVASGFCKTELFELMKKYQFSVRIDLSVNSVSKGSKSFSSQQCESIVADMKSKELVKFAKDNGFGNNRPMAVIPGRENLPLFTFREWIAGLNFNHSILNNCESKSSVGSVVVLCNSKVFDLAGAKAGSITQIYKGQLSAIRIISSADEAQTILDAFKAKYGNPCKSSVEVWQNRAGAKFDNPVFTWCFKTGDLRFSSIGSQRDNLEINYEDINKPETEAPTVNF